MFNNKKEMVALQEANQHLNDSLIRLQEENANYKQTISSFVGVKTGFEAEINKLKLAHKQELQSYKDTLDKEKASVAKRVNKALADIGVKEFASEEISYSTANDDKSIYDGFVKLADGAEKTAYFKKHEATLTKVLGFRKI